MKVLATSQVAGSGGKPSVGVEEPGCLRQKRKYVLVRWAKGHTS